MLPEANAIVTVRVGNERWAGTWDAGARVLTLHAEREGGFTKLVVDKDSGRISGEATLRAGQHIHFHCAGELIEHEPAKNASVRLTLRTPRGPHYLLRASIDFADAMPSLLASLETTDVRFPSFHATGQCRAGEWRILAHTTDRRADSISISLRAF